VKDESASATRVGDLHVETDWLWPYVKHIRRDLCKPCSKLRGSAAVSVFRAPLAGRSAVDSASSIWKELRCIVERATQRMTAVLQLVYLDIVVGSNMNSTPF
jgi:hypothetical protein